MRKGIKIFAVTITCCVINFACQKELPVEEVIKQPEPDKNEYGWQLSLSDTLFGGCIDTAYFTSSGQAKTLVIQGSDGAGNILTINLSSTSGSISTGTYATSMGNANFSLKRDTLYTVGNSISPFAFHVNTINDTLIEGEFEASFYDSITSKRLMVYDGKLVAKIGRKSPCKPFVIPTLTAAEFTLESGTGGSCSGVTTEGNYYTSIPLDNTNFVKLKVNVTKPGTYAITTATVNGIKFAASNTFSTTGIQTIALLGSGTPGSAGATSIPVTAGSSTCSFSINVVSKAAVFTLVGTPNSCTDANVQGLYAQGFQLSASNKVELKVDVTSIGTYAVAVGPVNGISFNGAGIFSAYGLQKLVLQGSGVPTIAGDYLIPVTASGAACSFTVSVKNDTTSGGACNVANNTASLSGFGNLSFDTIKGALKSGFYELAAKAQGGNLKFEFFGSTKPLAGVYTIRSAGGAFAANDVRVNLVASNINWAAAEGKVTVTVANDKITTAFCNINFSGSPGGTTYTAKGEGKATEQ